MAKKWNKKSAITSALRQVWRWSPYPKEAKLRAKVKLGSSSFKCAKCGKFFKESDVRVDHLDTVVPMDWVQDDWTTYVERLFCPSEQLQILCKKDHDEKTKEERRLKKSHRLKATENPSSN